MFQIGRGADPKEFQRILDKYTGSVEFTKGKTNVLLKRWRVNLNAAGQQTVNLMGNFVYGLEATDGNSVIHVQFSRKDISTDEQHPVFLGLGYIHPFDKIHLRWDAQTGEYITLLIGNLMPEFSGLIDNRTGVIGATLLTEIRDQLQGDLAAEGFNEVAIGAAATQIIAANANRKSILIQHKHDGVGLILLGFDNTVAANKHFIALAPNDWWSSDDYRGEIQAIRTGAATNAMYGEV